MIVFEYLYGMMELVFNQLMDDFAAKQEDDKMVISYNKEIIRSF